MMGPLRIDADRLGQIAGTACAVHCALSGLALGLLSVVGLGFLGSLPAEIAFISVTISVGTWALVHGMRKHHSWIPAAVFITGLACIGSAHAVGHQSLLGTLLSVAGGLGLVSFHVVNQRLNKNCACDHCHTGH